MTVVPFQKRDPSKEKDKFAKVPLWLAARAAVATKDPASLVLPYLLYLSWKAQDRAFAVPNGWLESHGVSRKTKVRVLRDLEASRLITVDRSRGRSPRVEFVVI
jgi:hypothetical protein